MVAYSAGTMVGRTAHRAVIIESVVVVVAGRAVIDSIAIAWGQVRVMIAYPAAVISCPVLIYIRVEVAEPGYVIGSIEVCIAVFGRTLFIVSVAVFVYVGAAFWPSWREKVAGGALPHAGGGLAFLAFVSGAFPIAGVFHPVMVAVTTEAKGI